MKHTQEGTRCEFGMPSAEAPLETMSEQCTGLPILQERGVGGWGVLAFHRRVGGGRHGKGVSKEVACFELDGLWATPTLPCA